MTQATFGLFVRPERVRNVVDAPLLPDEACRADEERRRRRLVREKEVRQRRLRVERGYESYA